VKAFELRQEFQRRFGTAPKIFRAPGRVNLIGEHTDYNDGWVMPVAIDLYAWVGVAPRTDSLCVIHSINFDEAAEFVPAEIAPGPKGTWSDCARGVTYLMRAGGFPLRGANLLLYGEIPMGAGLGSSAAYEVSVGYALQQISRISLDLISLAKICQRAENEFAGAHCGIMDQLISCSGRANTALFLDCRSLHYRTVPLPQNASLVVCNTKIKHAHAAGEYNARRIDCETGARILGKEVPGLRALRDVSLSTLERLRSVLPEVIYRRCRHVVSENARVLDAALALEQRDLKRCGGLMYESHRSLRDDFQVSCPELDLLVDLASRCAGVYGSRMTGGGFGGCTVSLVETNAVKNFLRHLSSEFEKQTHSTLETYVFNSVGGVEEVRNA